MCDDSLQRRFCRGGQTGRSSRPTPAVRGASQSDLPLDGANGRRGGCRRRDAAGIPPGVAQDRPVCRKLPVRDLALPRGGQRVTSTPAKTRTDQNAYFGAGYRRSFVAQHRAKRTTRAVGRGTGAARFRVACHILTARGRGLSVSRHCCGARHRRRHSWFAAQSSPPVVARAPHRTWLAAVTQAHSLVSFPAFGSSPVAPSRRELDSAADRACGRTLTLRKSTFALSQGGLDSVVSLCF